MNNVKDSIGWADFTINPVKGKCPVACPYCYARRLYDRFHWNPEVRYDALWWESLNQIKKPSRIFVGSTMELFGDWVKWEWLKYIIQKCETYPQHTFIFLTKQPQNLAKFPFPPNCWVGVSVVDKLHFLAACKYLSDIQAKVKFLSFEPLLESVEPAQPIGQHLMNGGIGWVIIGQQTPLSAKTMPHVTDIQKIIRGANEIPIPVFLKNNLSAFLPFQQFPDSWKEVYKLRQEFPKEVKA